MGARKIKKGGRFPRRSASVGMADRKSVPLVSLPSGASGVIVRMDLPEGTAWKFMEMGFGVGRHLRLVRRAPLGDPLEVELLGYQLAVRARDVQGIIVRPLGEEAPS